MLAIGKTYRLTLVPESAAPPEAKGVSTRDDFTDLFWGEPIGEVKGDGEVRPATSVMPLP